LVEFLSNSPGSTVHARLASIVPDARDLAVLTDSFSPFAFDALENLLVQVHRARLLLSPSVLAEESQRVFDWDSADARQVRNSLRTAAIARSLAGWIEKATDARIAAAPVHQNLIHIASSASKTHAITGSSSFTMAGLGIVPSVERHLNTLLDTETEARSLLDWFDNLWGDAGAQDAKSVLLDELNEIYSEKSPELIYYLTLSRLFEAGLSDLNEDRIIKPRTGIKDTLVWNKLYRFQRDGVLGAIDKIEKHNGCIIADSVGLGKTFEALAIIKYYELRNDRVLVLCPKKLRENWTIYTVNDRRNLFADDRFNYDVLNHTDLTRLQGKSGEINLATLNWGNYDLVVIDESHNFRNNPARKEGLTRYSRLMHEIIQAGVKTKVLMLSATPVNNRMNDLKNQVAFITEGSDDALDAEGISSIEQTLKRAQMRFNQWIKDSATERSVDALLDALHMDYFKLLDLLTIARSRKHIEKYYDLSEVGDFPERNVPTNIKADIDTQAQFPPLREINRDIRRLNLSSYAPLKYVLPDKLTVYSKKYDMQLAGGSVFKQIDREQNLIHLMRVNLLKRMESSINSFALSLGRLLANVQELIERIDNHDETAVEELSIEDIEIEDEAFTPHLVGRKVKVLLKDVDRIRWKQELKEDEDLLIKLLRQAREIDASRDEKLRRLKEALEEKWTTPLNPGNAKVIVFTAFADTAQYLYDNIADWAAENRGCHSALVTGVTGGCRTTMPRLRKDISSIITSFSPLSKERDKIDETLEDEIDILIATDCISEGQNLQDCDYLVNYDIHWNPVRIIQRFGRIDRLGSQNQVVQLVNFWPNMELDEYINLEARVSGRMVLLDISATGEENIIESASTDTMNDLEYRRRQLEQLQHEVVDMEDLSDGISITDMTLNDFRMDLAEYMKANGERLERMDLGAFAVTCPDNLFETAEIESGVLFCLRSENDVYSRDSSYALAPHYLVYVSDAGEIRLNYTQAKKALDLLKKLSIGHTNPDEIAIQRLNRKTDDGQDMSHYQSLLAKAVAAITGKAEDQGVESLFQRGGTALDNATFQGIDDFEVVAYLILLERSEESS